MKGPIQPNELCMVRNVPPPFESNNGKYVTTVSRVSVVADGWCCIALQPLMAVGSVSGRHMVVPKGGTIHFHENHLFPIRDPGPDAVDESHSYLPPVPSFEELPIEPHTV